MQSRSISPNRKPPSRDRPYWDSHHCVCRGSNKATRSAIGEEHYLNWLSREVLQWTSSTCVDLVVHHVLEALVVGWPQKHLPLLS